MAERKLKSKSEIKIEFSHIYLDNHPAEKRKLKSDFHREILFSK